MKFLLIAVLLLSLTSCRLFTWTVHVPGGYYVTTCDIDLDF